MVTSASIKWVFLHGPQLNYRPWSPCVITLSWDGMGFLGCTMGQSVVVCFSVNKLTFDGST